MCLMHFSAEVFETFQHWCRSVVSAPTQKFETLRHQTHGAEMSWVRSVRTPEQHTVDGEPNPAVRAKPQFVDVDVACSFC